MKAWKWLFVIAAAMLTGCGEREPDNTPVTQVNTPRPTNISETNVPPIAPAQGIQK